MNHLDARLKRVSLLERKMRGWRAIGFLLAAGLSTALSVVSGAALALELAAWTAWGGFAALVLVHRSVRRGLGRLQKRVELQRQLERLSRLEPQVKSLPAIALRSNRATRLARDLDLLSPTGFLSLFPFFLSTQGRQTFVDFLLESPPALEVLRRRQAAAEFWQRRVVLRRKVLRLAASLETELDAERLHADAAAALAPERAAPMFWIVCLSQLGFFALMAVAVLIDRKWLGTLGLGLWMASYVFVGRRVDLFSAYPRAMALGAQLRVLRETARVFSRLAEIAEAQTAVVQLRAFAGASSPLARLREIEQAAGAMGVRQNPILALFINLLFPWDLFWTLRFDRARRRLVSALPEWLRSLAEIEASLVFAEWNAAHGSARPEFVEGSRPSLSARGLAHPLIAKSKRVANDIELGESARCHLVTGSNMAGKSTFLRAIGLNLLLANAGAQVVCRSLRLTRLDAESSMRPADSLADGFSSFYAEVADLVEIVKQAEAEHAVAPLYLVDEIFRGTNNRERRIGAEAVIRALAKTSALGLVTTHDLDLASLQGDVAGLRNHHFGDDVADGKMTFSYEYRAGACPSTNAIKVMRAAGLPVAE